MRKFILVMASLGLAGLAYADDQGQVSDETAPDAEVLAEATIEADAQVKTERAHCLKYTGSRIRPRDGCIELAGRVHEGERLKLTGDANVGEALSRIDPSVRIGKR